MSFEIYVQCLHESDNAGISTSEVRSLFPVIEAESHHEFWRVLYDAENSCDVLVTPLPSDPAKLQSLCISRPCVDPRLWEALAAVLRMGPVVAFWPGGPLVVADDGYVQQIPEGMIVALGQPKLARSGDDILRLLGES